MIRWYISRVVFKNTGVMYVGAVVLIRPVRSAGSGEAELASQFGWRAFGAVLRIPFVRYLLRSKDRV